MAGPLHLLHRLPSATLRSALTSAPLRRGLHDEADDNIDPDT